MTIDRVRIVDSTAKYVKPNQDPEHFCETMDKWAELRSEASTTFAQAWRTVRLAISKSCLLSRTLYGNEKPSQTPCPVHKGVWSGIHHGWPETFWNSGKPIEESAGLREWYDQGCRCFQHKACNCTTGWNPDKYCGCLNEDTQ